MDKREKIAMKSNKADLIIGSDLHLRETRPICRTDDYWAAQWRKLQFIRDLQKKHDCPVVFAGDITDYWKCSPWLLTTIKQNIPDKTKVVYGQHDLPQHSLKLANKSGLYNLAENRCLEILDSCHYSKIPKIDGPSLVIKDRKILVWHTIVWYLKIPWLGCTAPSATMLLKRYPNYDLIITGDNHKSFVADYEGRLLINPGSMMRMDADQIGHKPQVFLWFAKDNTISPIYLPIEPNVISREHIDIKVERDNRIKAFIERLQDNMEHTLSFDDNLRKFIENNTVNKRTMQIIRQVFDMENLYAKGEQRKGFVGFKRRNR